MPLDVVFQMIAAACYFKYTSIQRQDYDQSNLLTINMIHLLPIRPVLQQLGQDFISNPSSVTSFAHGRNIDTYILLFYITKVSK